ncbi:coenzyme F420-0:L-glutamate ligase [Methanohalophilus profundi]|uniref:coenzyme F420-0:L-glutamate ligase n=1 Tax=Methanohalophilus profundi TaxID=2138083 RepID=UPI0013ED37A9|nr:coenzyme F420-0:L-glutamate ligase [Methanohalophilus profundi]
MRMEAFTVDDIPLVKPGDDIAAMICERAALEDGDVLVIASTIIAKAENELFSLEDITPSACAIGIGKRDDKDPRLVQAVLDRCSECFVESPVMLVQSDRAHVCINAGVDDSNVENDLLADLPQDADASARSIGQRVEEITGCRVAVVVTDTNGRAFRLGQTGVAIGLYHATPIYYWRGKKDLFGYEMQISEEAVADEVAAAANLLMGEGSGGNPVVVVRGIPLFTEEKTSARQLYRPDNMDLIKKALRIFKES